MNKNLFEQFKQYDLEIKERKSLLRIKEWYENWEGTYISFSGGVDSTVLADLVHRNYSDVPLLFSNTGLEYPELVDFVYSFIENKDKVKEYKEGKVRIKYYFEDNIYVVFPEKSFKEVIDEYGYPVISKRTARSIRDLQNPTENNEATRRTRLTGRMKNGKKTQVGKLSDKWLHKFFDVIDRENLEIKDKADFKVGYQCCNVMKKRPFHKFEKLTDRKPYVGTMATESMYRKNNYLRYGCNAFDLKKPQSRPLSFWKKTDILEYIKKYNIPYCKKIYGEIKENENGEFYTTKEQRTGCIFCMFGVHLEEEPNRFQRLKKTHPKLWNYCMNHLKLKDVLEFINVPYE